MKAPVYKQMHLAVHPKLPLVRLAACGRHTLRITDNLFLVGCRSCRGTKLYASKFKEVQHEG